MAFYLGVHGGDRREDHCGAEARRRRPSIEAADHEVIDACVATALGVYGTSSAKAGS